MLNYQERRGHFAVFRRNQPLKHLVIPTLMVSEAASDMFCGKSVFKTLVKFLHYIFEGDFLVKLPAKSLQLNIKQALS